MIEGVNDMSYSKNEIKYSTGQFIRDFYETL